MFEDKVSKTVERLFREAYQSTFSGEGRIPRFAIRYRQGNRTFYTTALSIPEIVNITHIDSIDTKEDTEPAKRWNRPLNEEHVEGIINYLTNPETKDNYLLPPITLDSEIPLEFVDCGSGEENQMTVGFLLIPINYHFHVTDGQHRLRALSKAVANNKELERHSIAVNIVQENTLEKVHQDFADCAKVKPIAKSLITTFETRDAIRVFTKEVCNHVPLFLSRVEMVTDSVGKTSSKLYTINHVKIACEELLLGDATGQDRTKSRLCAEILVGANFDVWLQRIVKFFNLFTEANPQWKRALSLDSGVGQGSSTLRNMKDEYIIFNGTALAVIGRAGHEILKNTQLFEHHIEKLANLDWRRTVESEDGTGLVRNPFWEGNILIGGRVANARHALVIAGAKIKRELRLPLTDKEQTALDEFERSASQAMEVA